jgi:uncharacterized protein YcbK (DUF882 family)
MQLTQNFSKHEFETAPSAARFKMPADINLIPTDKEQNIKNLAANLQVLRNEIGVPVRILSGYRSAGYNSKVGGAMNSQHKEGKAADIVVEGLTPEQVAKTIEKLVSIGAMKQGGIGIYKNFVHYDIRGTKARWRQ